MTAMNANFLLEIVGQVLGNPTVIAALMLAGGVLVAGWLLATAWAFRQLAFRSDSLLARYLAATFVLLSGPILMPIAVAVIALVRPHEVAGERRISRLLETVRARAAMAPACDACGRAMDERWVRCPGCAAWSGRQCGRCERWAPAGADICPWCTWAPGGAEQRPRSAPELRPQGIPARIPAARTA